jgi:hypothetical protein
VFNAICLADRVEYRLSIRSWDAMLKLASESGWNPSGPRKAPGEDAPLMDERFTGAASYSVMYDPQDMAPSDAISLADHLCAFLSSAAKLPATDQQPTAVGDAMSPLDYFIANASLTRERVQDFVNFLRRHPGFCFMSDET